ncbi:MAG TPA: GYD domain-containing protein [Casimicrobiaceae bacterium]|nr:GYD domain-containing protein [Casimicrobiaceae bacterium]
MATYIMLGNFTEQGIKSVKDSPSRYETFKSVMEKAGVQVKSAYYTMGAYDMVVTVEGSDEAVMALLLKLGSQGNVRTQTLRGVDVSAMKQMVGKL